jgi:GAF domain-containing protein
MTLPLMSAEKVIGALDVQSRDVNAFNQDDLDLLGVLADQVSLAIENARLFEEARRSLAEAEAFSRQYLREGWSRLTKQQQVLGYRYDTAGAVALTRPVPLSGQDTDLAESSVGHHVNVPIMLRGEVIGNLVVQTSDEKKWSDDELDLIRAVADRVALSAENARLFEETSRRAERERMVSEITSKIRSSNDPAEMIQLAIQELKNALGVSRIDVIPQRASSPSGHQDA